MTPVRFILSLLLLFSFTGCATLDVSPRLTLEGAAAPAPVRLGIRPLSDRVRSVIAEGKDPLLPRISQRYANVVLLPSSSRFDSPETLRATYGIDQVLDLGVNDFSVNGSLNPLWFASIPLVFFKPYAPIVTFEAVVTLDVALLDLSGGKVLLQKVESELVTDHFSPKNPQEKVQELIDRGINNALVSLFRDLDRAAC
ncbi:MAG: hypothetical protein Fur0034_19300 [Desulfuromonadia bacterium]